MRDFIISSIATGIMMSFVIPYITGYWATKTVCLYRKVRKAWRNFAVKRNHYAGDW